MSFPRQQFSPEIRAKVVAMYRHDFTQDEIAAQLKVSTYHVTQILNESMDADERKEIGLRHHGRQGKLRHAVMGGLARVFTKKWVK